MFHFRRLDTSHFKICKLHGPQQFILFQYSEVSPATETAEQSMKFQDIFPKGNKISPELCFRSRCYIVTRCTNLVSVHYFLPLAISAKMLINKVASGNWACVNGI